ncbi:MAG: hypothetical protein M3081_16385 [Gemmatimonadota bacterium]|nr:hypothetical protein [Gemmatimonadota bacterium]
MAMQPSANNESPERQAERDRVAAEIATRVSARGASLTGKESPDELVSLLEAIERFERAVEHHGGDLMVDEAVPANEHHATTGEPTEPDDRRFVLPSRLPSDSAAAYLARIDDATSAIKSMPRPASAAKQKRRPAQ